MITGGAPELLSDFEKRTSKGVFTGLRSTRQGFANAIRERMNNPGRIHQRTTSLCGPASFLYCWLRKDPTGYVKYVIDLYEKGEASVGSLAVKAGSDCRRVSPAPDIAEVDWVALASLRDSENSLFDYDTTATGAGGISMPHSIASWLRAACYSNVENRTNLMVDKNLSDLIQASSRYSSGSSVFLFIGANVLEGKTGRMGRAIPDHWVVLTSDVYVGDAPALTLLSKGEAVDDDDSLLSATVNFTVYTWGQDSRPASREWSGLQVRDFLDFFYGFVSGK